jgi:hypothetical protein
MNVIALGPTKTISLRKLAALAALIAAPWLGGALWWLASGAW